MNAIDKSAPMAASASLHGASRARIRYLDPLGLEAGSSLDHALAQTAELGFTAVMLPPPWAPDAEGDRFVLTSLSRVNPALGGGTAVIYLHGLARQAREHGLSVLIDLPLTGIAATFEGDAAPFAAATPAAALDPRQGTTTRTRPLADAPALGPWWAARLAEWTTAGIAGVRLLGLDQAPGALRDLRQALPDTMLIGWTPGVAREYVPLLQGADYLVSSLPWWDGQASWFWDELAVLRQVAPVLSCPEAPFDRRLAATVHDPALLAATLRRAAGLAVMLGDGWMVPAGFETGTRRPMDRFGHPVPHTEAVATIGLAELNTLMKRPDVTGPVHRLTGGNASPMAILRTDAADARSATHATLALINTDLDRPRSIDPSSLLPAIDGRFTPFVDAANLAATPGTPLSLAPGELAVFTATALPRATTRPALDAAAATRFARGPRVAIEAVTPCVDDGSLPAKRLVGEVLTVEADIICDGHDKLAAMLQWHEPGSTVLHEVRMRPLGNDRYRAEFPLSQIGAYDYTITAWRDAFASYKDELAKKNAAGLDVALELREGMALLTRTLDRSPGTIRTALADVQASLTNAADETRLKVFLSPELSVLMEQADDRPLAASLPRAIRIDAERSGAAFAAWYEVFPRSMSDDPNRHGTFRDVERHLPRVQAMGFDVLYFPPISPIGKTNRKGPNNTLTPAEGDPGSPYAIGSAEGGHDAIHPELGTAEDFRHLVAEAAKHGLEIAIDFAIQCSPDHPWLKQHRGWFDWRPDGSIKYAENPPKKYQDIVNVDFYATDAIPSLWVALAEAVMFWMEQGVRLVRVDNPHTKPLPFWQWMIAAVRAQYPDAVFLAEAFTRPKVMYRLAKVGFSQSYSYFTWRETKREMEEYLTELALPGPRDYFRPHFFVNTPDINPVYLQHAGRPAYLIRAALAATLSGLWGVYNGFELCEGTPVPGREEYLDSEKYQIRAWDWDRPGNIVPEITALNRIRRANPALRSHLTTTFLPAGSDAISVFMKATPDRSNVLVVAISFDPNQPQETGWEFPFWNWNVPDSTAFEVEDLLSGERFTWRGKSQFVRIDPVRPYAIWRVRALP
jgi:starch synthase (maltosyl-transferring)